MKKILLSLLLLAMSFSNAGFGQCTPDPIIISTGIPGIFPLPGDLPDGNINTPYSTVMTVVVPGDTTIDLEAALGIPFLPTINVSVDYQEVTGVSGLPAGMSYLCGTGSCLWQGGQAGCVDINGTPTEGGTFDLTVTMNLAITIPDSIPVVGGQQIPLPLPLTYTLFIAGGVNTDADLVGDKFELSQNVPNPSSFKTNILFSSPMVSDVRLNIMNIEGKSMMQTSLKANKGSNSVEVNTADYPTGVYFYNLSDGNSVISGKMVVQH